MHYATNSRMAKKSQSARVEDNNYRQLKALSKSNKMGLSLAKIMNLCIDRGMPIVIKEICK